MVRYMYRYMTKAKYINAFNQNMPCKVGCYRVKNDKGAGVPVHVRAGISARSQLAQGRRRHAGVLVRGVALMMYRELGGAT